MFCEKRCSEKVCPRKIPAMDPILQKNRIHCSCFSEIKFFRAKFFQNMSERLLQQAWHYNFTKNRSKLQVLTCEFLPVIDFVGAESKYQKKCIGAMCFFYEHFANLMISLFFFMVKYSGLSNEERENFNDINYKTKLLQRSLKTPISQVDNGNSGKKQ